MTFRRHALAVASALALTTALALPAAHAFEIPTPDPELKVRLDLTPKFSAAYRLKDPSSNLTKLDVAADRNGRILVQPDLTVPGHAEIFAVGDTVTVNGPDGRPAPGIAPAAKQQGQHDWVCPAQAL